MNIGIPRLELDVTNNGAARHYQIAAMRLELGTEHLNIHNTTTPEGA
jgi:hypothetical protein